jgi:heat shock protein HspQ
LRYQIGDLVTKRKGSDFGVIVSVDKANSKSLSTWSQSQQYLKNSQDIYYVFFEGTGYEGPYYTSELQLKQSNGTTTY